MDFNDNAEAGNRPLWEEFEARDLFDLIGIMAAEGWERTESPAYDVAIVEAQLAHMRAGGSWETHIKLDSLYRDAAAKQSAQSALFGFALAAAAIANEGETRSDILFDRAMALAELVPVSSELRAECLARVDCALDECRRLRNQTRTDR